ncbi:hypothetical protein [Acidihalobacter ferrooxydans]|uniref:IrrE N-terminal-like domain-containing protein n=1 Tax=Acidihalobacter ferrooxydans TaxID=1765967 RepID=A0A1P8ULL4_9GAMM|nr:hypothetical protein [Acidihalobacter ferrooxydans]APZ44726.1 hypothetical protein BW247_13930 [Acidihalobacter ferrooxydans]
MLTLTDLPPDAAHALLRDYGLELVRVAPGTTIPGSYWGEPEAGLIGTQVYARPDTPAHSLLHESCHAICMDAERRAQLHTDAGGTEQEENAVCYLQILLAERLPGLTRARLMHDMDTWGYSFRLGSAADWFEQDATDARDWLLRHGLIDAQERAVIRLRT